MTRCSAPPTRRSGVSPAACTSARAPRNWSRCLPAPRRGGRYRLAETAIPGHSAATDTALFDGVDTSIRGLARFAGESPPDQLVRTLDLIGMYASDALRTFERGQGRFHRAGGEPLRGPGPGREPLISGLETVRDLRARLAGLGLSERCPAGDRFPAGRQGAPVRAGRPARLRGARRRLRRRRRRDARPTGTGIRAGRRITAPAAAAPG